MYVKETTVKQLNALLTATFQMNSICDNIAYNAGALKAVNFEDIFHHKFAHAFPALADQISDLMISKNYHCLCPLLTNKRQSLIILIP